MGFKTKFGFVFLEAVGSAPEGWGINRDKNLGQRGFTGSLSVGCWKGAKRYNLFNYPCGLHVNLEKGWFFHICYLKHEEQHCLLAWSKGLLWPSSDLWESRGSHISTHNRKTFHCCFLFSFISGIALTSQALQEDTSPPLSLLFIPAAAPGCRCRHTRSEAVSGHESLPEHPVSWGSGDGQHWQKFSWPAGNSSLCLTGKMASDLSKA